LAALLSQLAGGLPSSYHRDQQLLKAPFFEIVRKGQQLFEIVARLIPALEIDEQASAAASTTEIHAANEACRLAAEGVPFRDAYAQVAQQIQSGSFAPNESILRHRIEAPDLKQHERWLGEKREFLAQTTERLFDWK
jgi:argininosuccinate lyase